MSNINDNPSEVQDQDISSEVVSADDIINVNAIDESMPEENNVGPDHNVSADEVGRSSNIDTHQGPVSLNKYDQVPYESYAYPQSSPRHLYTVAKLFGLDAVDVKHCSVLEIGCASGGNIIPMALENPESKFVGIDFSRVQIERGNEHIKALDIKNLELKEVSILDINEDFGKFDYIVAHGILSWVSKDIQEKIFEICSKNLSENGVAYISYNTLPGWNSIQSIRDMMLFHTAGFDSPEIKAQQSRMLLEFIKEANEGNPESPYSKLINQEIKVLSQVGNSYLMHDHLEDINDPCYLYQFMQNAAKNNLQYLGDSMVSSMFVGNMPQKIAEKLYSVGNDIVRTEQYMDFLTNRRFRSTLLCHASKKLNRNLDLNIASDLYLSSRLISDKQINNDVINSNEVVEFRAPSGATFSSGSPVAKAMMLELMENRNKIWNHVDDIAKQAHSRLTSEVSLEDVRREVSGIVLRFVLAGLIEVSAYRPNFISEVSEKPEVSKLVRYQATTQPWVTDLCSEKKNLDVFGRVLVQYVNGTNNIDQIVEKMVEHFAKGDLSIKDKDGNPVKDTEVIKKEMDALVRSSIQAYAFNALLTK